MTIVPPRAVAATLLGLAVVGAGLDGPFAGDASSKPVVGATAVIAPPAEESVSIARTLRVAVGDDGTVVTVVTLTGPDAEEAVIRRRGERSSVVARTGEAVATLEGRRFGLRAIGRAWTADGAVLYLATTREGPSVLVLHDATGSRLVAFGADPAQALTDEAHTALTVDAGCPIELEVFELLGADAAPLVNGSTVRFPARLGPPCDRPDAMLEYRDGRYAVRDRDPERPPGAASEDSSTLLPPWRDVGLEVADGSDANR